MTSRNVKKICKIPVGDKLSVYTKFPCVCLKMYWKLKMKTLHIYYGMAGLRLWALYRDDISETTVWNLYCPFPYIHELHEPLQLLLVLFFVK